jgi:hypothetical protein
MAMATPVGSSSATPGVVVAGGVVVGNPGGVVVAGGVVVGNPGGVVPPPVGSLPGSARGACGAACSQRTASHAKAGGVPSGPSLARTPCATVGP